MAEVGPEGVPSEGPASSLHTDMPLNIRPQSKGLNSLRALERSCTLSGECNHYLWCFFKYMCLAHSPRAWAGIYLKISSWLRTIVLVYLLGSLLRLTDNVAFLTMKRAVTVKFLHFSPLLHSIQKN